MNVLARWLLCKNCLMTSPVGLTRVGGVWMGTGDFASTTVGDAICDKFAVSTLCSVNGVETRIVGTYVPQSGLDRLHPTLFYEALASIENHMQQHPRVFLCGDFNSWVGNMHSTTHTLGQYNLPKQNGRGMELL
eukprot:6473588-Amphidinium_carterae.1